MSQNDFQTKNNIFYQQTNELTLIKSDYLTVM